jgi:hypothetical protein
MIAHNLECPEMNCLHLSLTDPGRTLRVATTLLFTCVLLAGAAFEAHAQDAAGGGSDPQPDREATLQWLDKYLADTVLMSPEGVAKIRDAVAQMSPSQLESWLRQTQQLRTFVESPSWQETKAWLREYLRIQAVYSDEEIQQLRDDIFNADADQLLEILQRIQKKHDTLVWMHGASQQARASEVQQRNARVAQQASANNAARAARTSNLPLFGTGSASQQTRSTGYRPPGPLVTSREMARAAVWGGLWGGW